MKSTSKLGRDGRFWGLVMIAPTIIGLMILNIIPFFQTIYMSFSKTKAFGAYQFCGLENYLEMFRNAEFWKANWNSIYFCILTVPVGVFLALIVAVLLNAKIKGKTACRASFFTRDSIACRCSRILSFVKRYSGTNSTMVESG